MKKLITLLGTISLMTTGFSSVISCTNTNHKNQDKIVTNLDKIKNQLSKYKTDSFLVDSSKITASELGIKLSKKENLKEYKLSIDDNETFVKPSINKLNSNFNLSSPINDTQLLKTSEKETNNLIINNGKALVRLFDKNKEIYQQEIQWVSNDLVQIKNTINKLNELSKTPKHFGLPLPTSFLNGITLAELSSFVLMARDLLPVEKINAIDLKTIGTPEFITKFNLLLDTIENSIKGLIPEVSFLNIKIDFNKTLLDTALAKIKISTNGTVRGLLNNIAPDLVALLQWTVKDGIKQISDTKNVMLPLIQYLLKPVNKQVHQNMVNQYGKDEWFAKKTTTNFDSLFFHAFAGFLKDPSLLPSHFNFKIDGFVGAWFLKQEFKNLSFNQDNFLGEKINGKEDTWAFQIEPTKLLVSIIDHWKNIEVNAPLFNANNWSGIKIPSILKSIINGSLSKFQLSTILIDKIKPSILQSLGIPVDIIQTNNISFKTGKVTIMVYNNTIKKWEPLQSLEKTGYQQFLTATDFKFSFTNVQFKIASKNDSTIFYETRNDLKFDIRFSQ